MAEYKYTELTHKIIGAAMTVHRYLGCGFAEKVYQEALEQEFQSIGIPFKREPALHINYRGVQLHAEFIPDFICDDKVIVELKAVRELDDMHRSQTINYAKVAGYEVALLINFGETSLKFERFAVSNQ